MNDSQFSQIEKVGTSALLPQGEYTFRIDEAYLKLTQDKQGLNARFRGTVLDGEHKGETSIVSLIYQTKLN